MSSDNDLQDQAIRLASRPPKLPPTKSSDAPYLQLVNDLTYRYPVLNYLNYFIQKRASISAPLYPVRAAVLEFTESQVTRIDFDGLDGVDAFSKLSRYLTANQQCKTRMFLIEDLDPAFIELLGSHLNVDGTVFAHQIRDAHYSGGPWNGHAPKLPSENDPTKSFTLRYYETRYFDDPDMPNFSSAVQTLGNVSRQIAFGISTWNQYKSQAGHVGHVRHNTSFWSQHNKDGGWDSVVLLDPPIPQNQPNVIFPGAEDGTPSPPEFVENRLFQRGYRDFTPWPADASVTQVSQWAPTRNSLLDDISYYWTTAASQAQIQKAISSSFYASHFQRHIIAAIWMNTIEHLHATLSELETMLWEIERMIAPHLTDLQKERYMARFSSALNEVNTLRRRLGWYVGEMENNLYSLGIEPGSESGLSDYERNFKALYRKLERYQGWAERLMGVITSHVNLMETEKSISDSKSLSRLTVLGFFFVPISFVATFFSMGGEYAVGEGRFWVFWVVALPLTAIILVGGFGKWWLLRWREWKEERR